MNANIKFAVQQAKQKPTATVEDKSWNASRSGNIICPWQEHICDNTVGSEISEHGVKRVTKRGDSLEEINVQVNRNGEFAVLTPLGEAKFQRGKGDDVELDTVVDGGADDGGIDRGSKDSYASAMGCKELSHVDQGEHVTLLHEREEKHMEVVGFGAHGSKARTCWKG
ncbi:hypothetical protein IEQ34_006959 [Dendrobium chrysotoxum]|uniref:Uncharacterized protein n=1 Tax=Dendrobium chrysotoxum TaxID=161865 RepID=A0AAV7H890_DENCH|nr:hypothetical protein IEQ34_006959 [Dendrobium chrysotoxum]